MLKTAITGNMGSGKTTVCKIFESLGVPVFYADSEAKKLYRDQEVIRQVKKNFGNEVFDANDRLLRQALAKVVFNNPEALKVLNGIIHPRLMKRYRQWLHENAAQAYTLHEAAVIFENHLENEFDFIVNVSAPEALRLQRIRQRDHLPDREIIARMNRQWPDDKKNSLSQAVIVNDEKRFLIPQVLKIHNTLIKKAKHTQ